MSFQHQYLNMFGLKLKQKYPLEVVGRSSETTSSTFLFTTYALS